jgi:hypothetical protein
MVQAIVNRRRKSERPWLARMPGRFVVGVILLWLGVVIVRNGNTGLGVVLLALGVGLAVVSVPKLDRAAQDEGAGSFPSLKRPTASDSARQRPRRRGSRS